MRTLFASRPFRLPPSSRKRRSLWALHLLCLLLLGTLLGALPLPAAPALAQEDPNRVIHFSEPRLEKIVRGALGKLEGDITWADVQSV